MTNESMINSIFVISLGLAVALYLWWGFRTLPRERWQVLCTVPRKKQPRGMWQGLNYTFYGLFNANSVTFSIALFLVLLASLGISPLAIALTALALVAICVPASKLVARIVEKKASTLTVGGAAFVGFLAAPVVTFLLSLPVGRHSGFDLPVGPVMAALAIAHAFGEGLGRLACISFGCCYGKPLTDLPPCLQSLFRRWHFVFTGKTKKIAYAHHLDGAPVVPVQAITASLYCSAGLVGVALFLRGSFTSAFLGTLAVTQLWRFFSEFLRADFRGGGRLSAYQIMGLITVAYGVAASLLLPPAPPGAVPILATGLKALWHPAVLLFLQALWVVIFLFTGKSQVTGAEISFHVVSDKI